MTEHSLVTFYDIQPSDDQAHSDPWSSHRVHMQNISAAV